VIYSVFILPFFSFFTSKQKLLFKKEGAFTPARFLINLRINQVGAAVIPHGA